MCGKYQKGRQNIKTPNSGDPWVAQWFSACLWPRVRSWRPGIESHIGLLMHGACFSLCLCLCLPLYLSISISVAIINKFKEEKKEKNRPSLQSSNCRTIYQKNTKILIQRGMWTLIFVAALSTIAKLWKQPKCPSELVKMWHIHTKEYYSAIKKNEISLFAMTWMELESLMLSKISQSEKDKYHMISLISGT